MNRWMIILLTAVLLGACSPPAADPLAPVQAYLVDNIGEAYFGGEVFCAYDVLDTAVGTESAAVYVWALCAEYYVEDGRLVMGTASSLPVALYLEDNGQQGYRVNQHELPGNGIEYGPSLRRIFPAAAIAAMCEGKTACYNDRAWRLEDAAEAQARAYFGLE